MEWHDPSLDARVRWSGQAANSLIDLSGKLGLFQDGRNFGQTRDRMVRSDIGLLFGTWNPDPDGTDTGVPRPRDITLQAITDHDGLGGAYPEFTQKAMEDLRFWLSDTMFP